MQPFEMTLQRYAVSLVVQSCKIVDEYDDGILNDGFIHESKLSVSHSLQHYWAQNPQTDLTVITFQVESLLFMKKGAAVT